MINLNRRYLIILGVVALLVALALCLVMLWRVSQTIEPLTNRVAAVETKAFMPVPQTATPAPAAERREVPASLLKISPTDDVAERFKKTHLYAHDNGFVGGFPDFHVAYTGGGVPWTGAILLRQGAAERREVPASELKISPTDDIAERFRKTHLYAYDNGFVGGFPDFDAETRDGMTWYGAILLRQGAAERREVPASELKISPTDDIAERFRKTQLYAYDNGFVGGFPDFHAATRDGVTVYGTILIRKVLKE